MNAQNQVKAAALSLDRSLHGNQRRRHQTTAEEINLVAQTTGFSQELIRCAAWQGAPLSAAQRIVMPILLVNKQTKKADSYDLDLCLLMADHWRGATGFVPAAAMMDIAQKNDFSECFITARMALNQLDTEHPLWPDDSDWAVRWEIHGLNAGIILEGGSLGGALAVGVAALLNDNHMLPEIHADRPSLMAIHQENLTQIAFSAEITGNGSLKPVDDLVSKSNAAKARTIFTGGAEAKAEPKGGKIKLAASSGRPVHAATLRELFCLLRELHRKSIEVTSSKKKHGLLKLAAVVALSMLGFIIWQISAGNQRAEQEAARIAKLKQEQEKWAHPSTEMLRERLPFATINKGKAPDGCKHLIALDHFDPATWREDIQPVLKLLQEPFALTIGRPGRRDEITKEPCPLEGLGDLTSLTALSIINSRISELPRMARLKELRQLVIVGSAVKDVTAVVQLQNLRTVVLDSPYIRELPSEWNLPVLQDLYVHVRSSDSKFSLDRMPELKHLALTGENFDFPLEVEKCQKLEDLWLNGDMSIGKPLILPSLASLRRLIIYNSTFSKLALADTPKLEHIVLHGSSLDQVEGWERVPRLQTVQISRCPNFNTENLRGIARLNNLTLSGCKSADIKEIARISGMKQLQIIATPVVNIEKLSSMSALDMLGLHFLQLGQLPSLDDMRGLKILDLSHSWLKQLPSLSQGEQCKIVKNGLDIGPEPKNKSREITHSFTIHTHTPHTPQIIPIRQVIFILTVAQTLILQVTFIIMRLVILILPVHIRRWITTLPAIIYTEVTR